MDVCSFFFFLFCSFLQQYAIEFADVYFCSCICAVQADLCIFIDIPASACVAYIKIFSSSFEFMFTGMSGSKPFFNYLATAISCQVWEQESGFDCECL